MAKIVTVLATDYHETCLYECKNMYCKYNFINFLTKMY